MNQRKADQNQEQKPESRLLELEYAHATQNLFNADQLRERLSQFHVVITGVVVTVAQVPGVWPQAIAGLAFIVFVFGLVIVVAFVRLRMLAIASYQAQNLIRQYYIKYHPDPYRQDLRNALLWDEPSIPQKESMLSHSFLSSLLVILLNSVVLGVGIYEALQVLTTLVAIVVAVGVSVVICGVQISLYLIVLNRQMAKSGYFQEKLAALRGSNNIASLSQGDMRPSSG